MNKKPEKTKALSLLEPKIFDLSVIAQGSADLQDNLDQIQIRLPQIRILHTAQMFEMPTGEKVPSFEGLILDFNRVNSYWPESFDKTGGGTPPGCFSLDGVRPSPYSEHLESDFCASCSKNVFGSSDKGRGKACKGLKRVHVLTEPNQLLPYRLTLPPSNLKAFDGYVSRLVGIGYPWRMVITTFSLKATKNKDGITYAEIVLDAKGQIPKEQIPISKQVADCLMPILRDRDIRPSELDQAA
jgi:hypothetical protein